MITLKVLHSQCQMHTIRIQCLHHSVVLVFIGREGGREVGGGERERERERERAHSSKN